MIDSILAKKCSNYQHMPCMADTSLTRCLLVLVLLMTFVNSLTQTRPAKVSGLFCVQTVRHSDNIPERNFRKC